MASTYSAALRLELMATGDQSGTWGTTTNTNLGTLLEQAITGVLSVAQGDVANFTPTSLDGASDQARNAVINLTGAMTANRNMVVPNANKLYLVKNSTTGGFSVTAKTSAGTGVLIPPGTARWVYADGTNVVDGLTGNQAANAFLAGYTTTATAAGTTVLTVASTQTQYFTGATTQTITLPVTSTLVLGQEYEIVNQSSGALAVNSSGGNLVATVTANSSVRVQVILTSGTSAASWNAIRVDLSAYLPLAGGTMTGQLVNTAATAGYTPIQLISTEAAAAAGPIIELYRNSASPAVSDILGQVLFNGEDSAGNTQEYGSIEAVIADPTSASEDGALDFYVAVAGTRTRVFSVGPNNLNTPTQFINGYATTVTAAGTTTLTVTSAGQQYFTGTTTQTVVLPVVSTLVLGQRFHIVNNSTGLVTVQSSGGNAIQVMGGTLITYATGAPGTELIVTCIATSGTGTASWAWEYLTPITQWMSWTPTFTGFGTVSGVSAWSRRVGDTLEMRVKYTSGTSTATEARMSMGFNGSNNNVTSNATKVPSIQFTGGAVVSVAGDSFFTILIESNVGYVTFGYQDATTSGLTKRLGASFIASGTTMSFTATIPLTGA